MDPTTRKGKAENPLCFPSPTNEPTLKWARIVEEAAREHIDGGWVLTPLQTDMLSEALTLMVNEHDGLHDQMMADGDLLS